MRSFRFAGSGCDDGVGGKNVFSRLVAGTNIGEASKPLKGVINPFQGRMAQRSPLICSSIAEGHNKSVLSVCATDELLLSASKDRTVKVWDLRNMRAPLTNIQTDSPVGPGLVRPQKLIFAVFRSTK